MGSDYPWHSGLVKGLESRDLGLGRCWAVSTPAHPERSLLMVDRGCAVLIPGHPGSSLGTWVLAGFNFEGWEGLGRLYPDLPGFCLVTRGLFTWQLMLTWPLTSMPHASLKRNLWPMYIQNQVVDLLLPWHAMSPN